MKLMTGAIALILSFTAVADEFDRSSSPQLLEKNYEAMHYMEMPFEVGKSTLTVSVDCQATEADAKQAVTNKLDAMKKIIDDASTKLNLGDQTEYWGYDLDNKISTSTSNPISNVFHAKDNQYFWTNRCTGARSNVPVRSQSVHSASVVVTVWFPNEDTTLNHLTALVTALEGLSEKGADATQVTCNSASGTNFDLDVTESTAKAAWAEIEAVSKERANDKVQADFSTTKYTNVWEGAEYFTRSQRTTLPRASVVKENGVWYAKFADNRSYTVFYKQSSEPHSDAGKLLDSKTYSVTTEAKTSEGLYGTLSIVVNKGCMGSKVDAEDDVSKVGNAILAKLRKINDGEATETDKLEIKDAFGSEYNPLQTYRQMLDKRAVNYYYNPCTLDTYETTQRPDVTAWRGTQVLKITSSDLDALIDLRDNLDRQYEQEIANPNDITVSTSWSATAKLSVLEQIGAELEVGATEKFLARGSDFQCDASNFSFACLANPVQQAHRGQLKSRGMAMESAAAMDYSEGIRSDVDASERGMKSFVGKYTITYTVRKVLVNHDR